MAGRGASGGPLRLSALAGDGDKRRRREDRRRQRRGRRRRRDGRASAASQLPSPEPPRTIARSRFPHWGGDPALPSPSHSAAAHTPAAARPRAFKAGLMDTGPRLLSLEPLRERARSLLTRPSSRPRRARPVRAHNPLNFIFFAPRMREKRLPPLAPQKYGTSYSPPIFPDPASSRWCWLSVASVASRLSRRLASLASNTMRLHWAILCIFARKCALKSCVCFLGRKLLGWGGPAHLPIPALNQLFLPSK